MKFALTTLGVSSASPMVGRYSSAHIFEICGRLFLLDCADGTQHLLQQYRIKSGRIGAVCITHIHGDHVFGLFGLLSSWTISSRNQPLHIYAPENFGPVLDFYNRYFTDGRQPAFPIIFHPITENFSGVIEDNGEYTITAFPLKHRIQTVGYRFDEKKRRNGSGGRSFAYCTDTVFFESLSDNVRGVDLLYHDSTFGDDRSHKAPLRFHSTSRQAATIARLAGVGTLVLGHFSSSYVDLQPLLEQAREVHERTELAEKGRVFEVPLKE